MSRKLIFTTASVGLFGVAALISNLPLRGDDADGDRNDRNFESAREIQRGFAISPVKLNLDHKDPRLVGLGSYIVNAQGGCNDCHTCPSYKPGHNPFPPPFGNAGDGQFNNVGYLAGGVDFGPPGQTVTSANLTPDGSGKPAGLTLEQFEFAIRTGHDPIEHDILAVMPWPYYRFMTDRDLHAIYSFLSSVPSASTPEKHCANAGE